MRALAPATTGLIYIGVIAALAATTSLGFVAAYAMPDIFGGLAILAAAALTAFPDRLGRGERLGLIALVTYAVLAHAENGLNVAAALVLGFLWSWRSGMGWRAALGRGAPVGVALALGLGLTTGGGMILNAVFGQPVHMAPFAGSRMLADGVAQPYLRRACPASQLAVCDLADSPPVEVEYYLWIYPLEGPPPARIADPAAYTLAQFERLQRRHVTDTEAEHRQRFVAEQSRLALGGLRTSPVAFVQQAFAATIVQVLNFGIGRDHDSAGMIIHAGPSLLRDQMDAILRGGVECTRPGSPTCGRYDLGWVTPLQYAIVLASVAFLGLRLAPPRRAQGRTGRVPRPHPRSGARQRRPVRRDLGSLRSLPGPRRMVDPPQRPVRPGAMVGAFRTGARPRRQVGREPDLAGASARSSSHLSHMPVNNAGWINRSSALKASTISVTSAATTPPPAAGFILGGSIARPTTARRPMRTSRPSPP